MLSTSKLVRDTIEDMATLQERVRLDQSRWLASGLTVDDAYKKTLEVYDRLLSYAADNDINPTRLFHINNGRGIGVLGVYDVAKVLLGFDVAGIAPDDAARLSMSYPWGYEEIKTACSPGHYFASVYRRQCKMGYLTSSTTADKPVSFTEELAITN